jgi:enterochelin esterase family protein
LEVEVIEMPYVRQATEFPVTYAYGPDSWPQPGVRSGVIHEHVWNESGIFPATTRRYWVYVPALYASTEPTPLMVFQDGWLYLDPDGAYRVGVVMDNLIHRGEMPATVGVFVDPGEPDRRNAEYDPFDDVYATFLLTEILPPVLDGLNITDDPEDWAIAGGSAGGYCAFSAAWHRPDRFRRVLSLVGGGPDTALIAQTAAKPLRVFMQAASRDTNWNAPTANMFAEDLRIAAALAEGGYDFRLVLGDGHHSPAPGNHGATILPDALRWLWRGHTSARR